jgi:hypothetical protein
MHAYHADICCATSQLSQIINTGFSKKEKSIDEEEMRHFVRVVGKVSLAIDDRANHQRPGIQLRTDMQFLRHIYSSFPTPVVWQGYVWGISQSSRYVPFCIVGSFLGD